MIKDAAIFTKAKNMAQPTVVPTILPPYPAGFLQPTTYPGNMAMLPANYGANIVTSDIPTNQGASIAQVPVATTGPTWQQIYNIPQDNIEDGEDEVDPQPQQQPPQQQQYIKRPSLFSILKSQSKQPNKNIGNGRGGLQV